MKLLDGIRVIEVSLLAPDGLAMHLADLGADVIKVEEPPVGDYVRDVGFQKVEGVSVLHRRWNRGKRSLALDLRKDEGRRVFEDLVRVADAVVEGLRPGALERRGLGYERLRELNPRVVLASLSGYGQSGPYRDLASHGVAYDAYAGLAPVGEGPGGFPAVGPHTQIGVHAGALFGAFAVVAAILHAQRNGTGCHLDVAEADTAAWWNGPRLETSGDATGERFSGLEESVRYQYYETSDGQYVLFMATEAKFWQRFCEAVDRVDLFERHPPKRPSDHDRGNLELRGELAALFATRTQREWTELFLNSDVPGIPVNVGGRLHDDPHFQARAHWLDEETHRMAILGTPIRVVDDDLDDPAPAPTVGQHTREVLRDVLGYRDGRVEELYTHGVVAGD